MIRRDDDVLRLDDRIRVEDVDALVGELLAHPEVVTIDLSGCTGLHAAAVQVLKAARRRVVPPADPFLRKWVWPFLEPAQRQGEP